MPTLNQKRLLSLFALTEEELRRKLQSRYGIELLDDAWAALLYWSKRKGRLNTIAGTNRLTLTARGADEAYRATQEIKPLDHPPKIAFVCRDIVEPRLVFAHRILSGTSRGAQESQP